MGGVIGGGHIFIQASKNGISRTINLPQSFWGKTEIAKYPKESKLFPTTYKAMYRAAKELGLAYRPNGYKNNLVTHAGRHRLAENMMNAGFADNVGDALNHRAKNSSAWYKKEVDLAKDRRRKRNIRRQQREQVGTNS